MPKVSVYLPEELYREVRSRRLPLSALTQDAVEKELRRTTLRDWVARERAREPRAVPEVDTSELMAEIREDFGT